jgi:hypothetical protein
VYGDDRAPLRAKAEAASRKRRNAAAKARRDAKATSVQAELEALLADEATRERLAALPGPKRGTLLERAEWLMRHAGATGRAKLLTELEAALGPDRATADDGIDAVEDRAHARAMREQRR